MENEIDGSNAGESLTLDQAAAAYVKTTAPNEADTGQSDDVVQDEGDTTDETELASEDAGDETDGETEDEGQADETEDEDEPESDQGRYVAKNGKVKLEDGSTVTVDDLIKGNLRDRDYRQKTMEAAEVKKTYTAQSEALTASQQQLENDRAMVIQVLQAIIGDPPSPTMLDPSHADFDILGYNQKKANQEAWGQYLQQFLQQDQKSREQKTAESAKTERETADREWAALVEKLPELKDQKRVDRFISDMKEHSAAYGIKPEELRAIALDHRQALVFKDAIAWRKLQASKANVQKKVEGRPPVQKGGKRLNPAEAKARSATDAMTRLGNTGRLDDAVAAYLATQK